MVGISLIYIKIYEEFAIAHLNHGCKTCGSQGLNLSNFNDYVVKTELRMTTTLHCECQFAVLYVNDRGTEVLKTNQSALNK